MRISGDVVIPCLSHSPSTQQQLQSLWLDNPLDTELFPTLGARLNTQTQVCLKLLQRYIQFNGQQQCTECDGNSGWTQERPGCALNMRSVVDSRQPSCTLGGNRRLNGFKSPSVGTSPVVQCTSSHKCFGGVTRVLSPVSALSCSGTFS